MASAATFLFSFVPLLTKMATFQEKTVPVITKEEAVRKSNEKLIEEVRNAEVLYNFRLPGNLYKDLNAKDNAWRKVAASMNQSGIKAI